MTKPRPDLVVFTPGTEPPPGFADRLAALADPAAVEVKAGRPGKDDLGLGRYLGIWHPAVTPAPGAVAALISHMDENPLVGIAVPRVEDASGRVLATCGRRPGIPRLLVRSRMEPLPLPGPEVETVSAPPLVVRPEALEETGPPANHNAAAAVLCRRAAARGWRIHRVMDAVFTAGPDYDPAPRLGFFEIWRAGC